YWGVRPSGRPVHGEDIMFRSIFGFAVFAVVAWLGLKILFGLLGGLIAIAGTILWLAALGFLFYLVLRVISPSTADKLRDMVKGRRAASYGSQGRTWLAWTCKTLQ